MQPHFLDGVFISPDGVTWFLFRGTALRANYSLLVLRQGFSAAIVMLGVLLIIV